MPCNEYLASKKAENHRIRGFSCKTMVKRHLLEMGKDHCGSLSRTQEKYKISPRSIVCFFTILACCIFWLITATDTDLYVNHSCIMLSDLWLQCEWGTKRGGTLELQTKGKSPAYFLLLYKWGCPEFPVSARECKAYCSARDEVTVATQSPCFLEHEQAFNKLAHFSVSSMVFLC